MRTDGRTDMTKIIEDCTRGGNSFTVTVIKVAAAPQSVQRLSNFRLTHRRLCTAQRSDWFRNPATVLSGGKQERR